MTNALADALVAALARAFPGVPIYTENVEQGFDGPALMVLSVEKTAQPYPCGRSLMRRTFAVHVFPSREGGRREADAAAETLFDALELLQLPDGPVRGAKLEAHSEDGALVFLATYSLFIRGGAERGNEMDELKVRERANA